MKPTVLPFFHKDSCTWSYVAFDPASKQAVIIDPVLDYDPKSGNTSLENAIEVRDAVQAHGLNVRWILETHAHADHLSSGHWLREQFAGAKLSIGEGICKVQKTFRTVFNLGEHFPVDGTQFDHLHKDGDRFMLGEIDVQVIATPGHTNDSVSYLIGDALFVGDTMFMPDGGTARCDFPGGDAHVLYQSIHRLFALPDATRVFVCHDYAPGGREYLFETSIGAEKAANIHVGSSRAEDDFVAMREARDKTLAMPVLILPSVQVNIRAGQLPEPEGNGVRYLKLPVDLFPGVPK
ncbi:MAG: putative metallo-hydrolase [Alphaproteobacteria bacterium ADurb.BinA280]|jgi:glyoxylase-like metal-dependent hydrolase (beta-lactamase superfamily II)|nr:MBL fold metallo-hydrolase [Xanthomonadales bacterium]MCC6506867.1 MBL fold metallo-hydrolase [Aquimonas sp.]OPZ13293.1 MAG: putative metallo-hydrolase [Alphaproteobacteria bacterium ADurb.BinA280]